MVLVDDKVIDAIYKISQAIWEKHGWMSSPNKPELVVYLEATMLYMNEFNQNKEVKKWQNQHRNRLKSI